MDIVPLVIAIFSVIGAGGFVAWRKINPEIESMQVTGFERLVVQQREELNRIQIENLKLRQQITECEARIESLEKRVP